jgi:hypothetical protein
MNKHTRLTDMIENPLVGMGKKSQFAVAMISGCSRYVSMLFTIRNPNTLLYKKNIVAQWQVFYVITRQSEPYILGDSINCATLNIISTTVQSIEKHESLFTSRYLVTC